MRHFDGHLVEDEDFKRRHIQEFISLEFPQANIITSRSVTSAIDNLDNRLPHVLLLDMSLPTFDIGEAEGGGRPQGFGGIEVLRHLKFSGFAFPVIVVTGYETFTKGAVYVDLHELERELKEEFPDLVQSVLYFNSAFDDWKEQLRISIEIAVLGSAN
ncbi:response regulator transcription factor [Tianweitania populi]|uniref:Response regulator n=1 Tax=Tianweitania populi TaxID=1607949 RepID=A0A8J3GLY3_9HYPH|nr:response regulator transcription factor [Tianweitania populi]GHD21258.1 hypothetical protein GCM10016234_34730 [Tianweitania populi]